jgi:hypothetical protein
MGGEGLQFEPEITDAREQGMQLRLVDDLAGELRGAAAVPEGQAVEGRSEALAQLSTDGDADGQGRRHHDRDHPAGLREGASCTADFTLGDCRRE